MLNILILGGGSSYFLRGLICCFKEDLIVGGVVSYRDFFAEAKTLQFFVADFAIHQILLSAGAMYGMCIKPSVPAVPCTVFS